MAPVEVFEVASFYAHFDILADAAPALPTSDPAGLPGPALRHGRAAAALLASAARRSARRARVVPAPCMGACHHAPACAIGHALVEHATPAAVAAAIAGDVPRRLPARRDLMPSIAHRARRCGAAPGLQAMLAALATSGLRGLGGAGFPAARKWQAVLAHPDPRHLVVNADEGEPGTFKDRYCLETDPHRVLEGMLLAAMAIGAEACWFYLRDEYPHIRAPAGGRSSPRWRRPGCCRCRCISAAVPAPISAARRRRCWRAWRAAAAIPATSRPFPASPGSSAARP